MSAPRKKKHKRPRGLESEFVKKEIAEHLKGDQHHDPKIKIYKPGDFKIK